VGRQSVAQHVLPVVRAFLAVAVAVAVAAWPQPVLSGQAARAGLMAVHLEEVARLARLVETPEPQARTQTPRMEDTEEAVVAVKERVQVVLAAMEGLAVAVAVEALLEPEEAATEAMAAMAWFTCSRIFRGG